MARKSRDHDRHGIQHIREQLSALPASVSTEAGKLLVLEHLAKCTDSILFEDFVCLIEELIGLLANQELKKASSVATTARFRELRTKLRKMKITNDHHFRLLSELEEVQFNAPVELGRFYRILEFAFKAQAQWKEEVARQTPF